MQRKGIEIGFQEIAMALLAVVFLILLVLVVLAIVDPAGTSVEIFGQRAEGLID